MMNREVCRKFLSFLQDHYKQQSYWSNSSLKLYEQAFKNVPADFLERCFDKYLQDHMPKFLPTLTGVK